MDRFRTLELETPLNEQSSPSKASNGKLPVLSLVEIGKVLGDGINRTYTLIYAVFIRSSPFVISIMISLRNLLQLATQSIFGRWSDQYGRKPFLLAGLLVSAFISFIFPTILDPLVFLLAIIIYSIAFGIFAPAWIAYLGDISTSGNRGSFIGRISTIGVFCAFVVMNAYIIDSAPEESKGHYVGVFSLMMGLATFLGSLLMGTTTEFLVTIIGKWETIYTMLIVVMIFRFIGGLNFYFLKYPELRSTPSPLFHDSISSHKRGLD